MLDGMMARPLATSGVPVRISAAFRAADDPLTRVGSLPVRIEYPDGDEQTLVLDPTPGRDGEFSGTFTPETAGSWFARVGTGGEEFIAAAGHKFDVRAAERELRDRTTDPSFATIMAARTGGKSLTVKTADQAAEAFSMLRVDHVREERESLWDRWPFSGFLLLLLFVEWTWRKALRQP